MDIVRSAPPDAAAKIEPLKLTAAQQKAQSDMAELETTAMVYEQANVEAAGLQAKVTRTTEEDARLKQLNASMEHESAAILSPSPEPSIRTSIGNLPRKQMEPRATIDPREVICKTR